MSPTLAAFMRELDRLETRAQEIVSLVSTSDGKSRVERARNADRHRDALRARQLVRDLRAKLQRVPADVIDTVIEALRDALELGQVGDDAVLDRWLATEALEHRRRQILRARKAARLKQEEVAAARELLRTQAIQLHTEHPDLGVTGVAKLIAPRDHLNTAKKLLRLDLHWRRRRSAS